MEALQDELRVPTPADSRILVADDDEPLLDLVCDYLRRCGYEVEGCGHPERTLAALRESDASLLVADLRMPGMTGLELARKAMEEDPNLAVIIMTGHGTEEAARDSLRLGADDYITKPFNLEELDRSVQRVLMKRALRVYRHLEGYRLRRIAEERDQAFKGQAEGLREVITRSLVQVVRALEAKHPHFQGHSDHVALVAEQIASELGLGSGCIRDIRDAGLLHNVGTVSVTDTTLSKGGKLGPEEFAQLKQHVRVGADILRPFPFFERVADFVLYHHERLNGSGYLAGLAGDQIPLGAQIVGLAEYYVALTEERPYRLAHDPDEAIETLRATEGLWFQSALVDALERASMTSPGS